MTENEARKLFVDTAKSYLGYSEASGKHRQIIDIYNAKTPLPRNYKVTYTDAWCATFVSACAIKCGMAAACVREQLLTPEERKAAERADRIETIVCGVLTVLSAVVIGVTLGGVV